MLIIIIFDADFIIIIDPVKKIKANDYICDNKFHLDILIDQYENELFVGLALISGESFILYKLIITNKYVDFKILKQKKIILQKRMRKGGQSAQRIGRIRDEKENKYVRDVAINIVDTFMYENNSKYMCENIILAGPSELKYKVQCEPIFKQYFDTRVIKIIDSEFNDNVIHKLIKDNEYLLININNEKFRKEQVTLVKELIQNASDKLVFGRSNVLDELHCCSLEYIYLDHNIENDYKSEIINNNGYGAKIIINDLLAETMIEVIGVKFW